MTNQLEALIDDVKAAAEKASNDDWGYDTDEFHDIANYENVLALIAALEQSQQKIAELEKQYENRAPTEWAYNQACTALQKHKDKIKELEASHEKLREGIAGIYNTIKQHGECTSLSALLSAAKRLYEESATIARIEADNPDRVRPVMFIDGDISPDDAEKLANVIREWAEEDKPNQLAVKLPDGLIEAVKFYEQVQRENPAVETGAWKDATDWILKEAILAAGITVQGGE